MTRSSVLLVLVLALSGCGADPVRVDAAVVETPPMGKALIVLIRPGHLWGAANSLSVSANSTLVAKLSNSSYTSFAASPGSVKLATAGGALSWPHREITIDVVAGHTYYIAWTFSESRAFFGIPTMVLDTDRFELLTEGAARALRSNADYVAPKVPSIPE